MKRYRQYILLLIASLSFFFVAMISNQSDHIIGIWQSEDDVRTIEIYKLENSFYGKILENKHQDKDKLVAGTVIMKDFIYEDGQWVGTLVIPSKDAQYKAILTLTGDNDMNAVVKLGPFSKSKKWKRVNN